MKYDFSHQHTGTKAASSKLDGRLVRKQVVDAMYDEFSDQLDKLADFHGDQFLKFLSTSVSVSDTGVIKVKGNQISGELTGNLETLRKSAFFSILPHTYSSFCIKSDGNISGVDASGTKLDGFIAWLKDVVNVQN